VVGKIIAGVSGWLVAGPVGALLGVLLGHQFDRGFGSFLIPMSEGERHKIRETFFPTLFSLLGHLAKSDGHISQAEIALTEDMMANLGLSSERKQEAIKFFKTGAAETFSVRLCVESFVQVSGRHVNLKNQLLSYLISLALADGELHSAEESVLRTVAIDLGFSKSNFEELIGMIGAQAHFGDRGSSNRDHIKLSDAYSALGVASTSSDSVIKRAYRKLVSQNHPDKLIGQGVPDDIIKLATERTQKIQMAYDLISESRKTK
tara:strand:- start:184 stop:969 length:786 start_codon:yes stop_codon:yes gene_type:complete